MALTEVEREYIKEVAANISAEVAEHVIEKVLIWHTQSCPHGKNLFASKWALIGGCISMALGSGGFAAVMLKLLLAV